MFLKALAIYNAARSHVIAVQLARSGSGERVNNQQRENCPDRGGNVSGRQVPVSTGFQSSRVLGRADDHFPWMAGCHKPAR
jgi:hypothetical protein